jgi:hypothetical protein
MFSILRVNCMYTLSYIKSNSLGVRGRFIRRKTVISIKQYENVFLLLFITPGESIPALYRGGGGHLTTQYKYNAKIYNNKKISG